MKIFSCAGCNLQTSATPSVKEVSCRGCQKPMVMGELRSKFTPAERKKAANRHRICLACDEFGLHERNGNCFEGCGLLAKPCQIDKLRLRREWTGPKGRKCWEPIAPPNEFGPGVGFIAVAYTKLGGTEVWHQTLLPRLNDVAGFVCLEPSHSSGDMERLGCPAGIGLDAARRLADSCSKLVVWGVGNKLGQVLTTSPRPRVISVGHGDGTSEWSGPMMEAQRPWTDQYVYLCRSGLATVPEAMRGTAAMIPNAPDPTRVMPVAGRAAMRLQLGIPPDVKLLVTFSRLSPEKRLDRLMLAAKALPPEYHLLVAGASGGWNDWHAEELRAMTGERVRVIDPVEAPGDLLAAADAYVTASEQEGYGLSTAEALLAGVPTIATPVGFLETEPHLARIVGHGADAAEWAGAIMDDFADMATQRARVVAARREMQVGHAVEHFAAAWERLLA